MVRVMYRLDPDAVWATDVSLAYDEADKAAQAVAHRWGRDHDPLIRSVFEARLAAGEIATLPAIPSRVWIQGVIEEVL